MLSLGLSQWALADGCDDLNLDAGQFGKDDKGVWHLKGNDDGKCYSGPKSRVDNIVKTHPEISYSAIEGTPGPKNGDKVGKYNFGDFDPQAGAYYEDEAALRKKAEAKAETKCKNKKDDAKEKCMELEEQKYITEQRASSFAASQCMHVKGQLDQADCMKKATAHAMKQVKNPSEKAKKVAQGVSSLTGKDKEMCPKASKLLKYTQGNSNIFTRNLPEGWGGHSYGEAVPQFLDKAILSEAKKNDDNIDLVYIGNNGKCGDKKIASCSRIKAKDLKSANRLDCDGKGFVMSYTRFKDFAQDYDDKKSEIEKFFKKPENRDFKDYGDGQSVSETEKEDTGRAPASAEESK